METPFSLISEEEIKNNILPRYRIEALEIKQIKFKDTVKQRAVYKIVTSKENYCLKKIYYSKEELFFVYSAMEWLFHYNIGVSRIVSTVDGNKYVLYKEMIFIMTNWIEGIKCDYDNQEDIISCSSNLSKIHHYTKKFKAIAGSNPRLGFDDINNSMYKHFIQILKNYNLANQYNDKFSLIFKEGFEKNFTLAKIAVDTSSKINLNNLSKSLCHLDYVNKNILFDSNHDIWIIDFDKCKFDYCIHDITYFLRRILKRENTKWNLQLVLSCLNKYEERNSLNYDEYKAILVYLAFPQKFWKLSRDYYNNISKCNQDAFCNLLSKSNEKVGFHYNFIMEFSDYINKKFT